jgi:hypothetical protein
MISSLLMLIVAVALICLVIWAIQTYLTVIPQAIRGVLIFIVIAVAALWIWSNYAGKL